MVETSSLFVSTQITFEFERINKIKSNMNRVIQTETNTNTRALKAGFCPTTIRCLHILIIACIRDNSIKCEYWIHICESLGKLNEKWIKNKWLKFKWKHPIGIRKFVAENNCNDFVFPIPDVELWAICQGEHEKFRLGWIDFHINIIIDNRSSV